MRLQALGLRLLVSPRTDCPILPGRWSLLLAAAALVTTLAYDAVTNVYTGIVWAQMTGGIRVQAVDS